MHFSTFLKYLPFFAVDSSRMQICVYAVRKKKQTKNTWKRFKFCDKQTRLKINTIVIPSDV